MTYTCIRMGTDAMIHSYMSSFVKTCPHMQLNLQTHSQHDDYIGLLFGGGILKLSQAGNRCKELCTHTHARRVSPLIRNDLLLD
jgi:hypothetical protein